MDPLKYVLGHQGICSSENNPFELRYTDISPGALTVQFEETIVHTGEWSQLANTAKKW